jgi:hypothetical protein
MAINIYPLNLSPAALGVAYNTGSIQPITAVGGTPPYTWSIISGSLPVGLNLITSGTQAGQITGVPLVADQYSAGSGPPTTPAWSPLLVNPSTFTLKATDSTAATATIVYNIPVGLFNEEECISIFEMLKACWTSDWYIVMSDIGTRTVKIGDIGNAAFGSIRLAINAYLNNMTFGETKRLRTYIREFDILKLQVQNQKNGSVDGLTGVSYFPQEKLMKLLELSKTVLPAYSNAEVSARFAHHGGSGYTGTVTGSGQGNGGFVTLSR